MGYKKVILGIALFASLSFAATTAQAQVLTQISFDDWLLACNQVDQGSAEVCVLSHAVTAPQGNVKLLGISILFDKETRTFPTQISVPLGTTLAAGLTLEVESSGRLPFGFSRCDAQGCYVEEVFAREVVDAFADGMKVSFADRVGQVLAITVSPKGILAGVDELESRSLSWTDYLSDFWSWVGSFFPEEKEVTSDVNNAAEIPEGTVETTGELTGDGDDQSEVQP